VMCADMDEDHLEAEYKEAADAEGSNVAYFAGDLREKLSVANLLSATIDAFDGIDILVNASRQVLPSNPLKPKEDNVSELINQNLMTSLRLTQAVSNWMIKHAPDAEAREASVGSIINLSSIASTLSQPELLGFSISSAAVDQMTRSMAVALADQGIRVNAVSFGSVLSASLDHHLTENVEYKDEIVRHTPLGRIGSADEVAAAVQYLASECSAFVTGQILTVDGGRTLIDPVVAPAH